MPDPRPTEEPAFVAWRKLHPQSEPPSRVDVLKPAKRKSAVYRLTAADPREATWIAKRCRKPTARLERAIYASLLPRTTLPAIRLLGFIEEKDSDDAWLFLEDAGESCYSSASPEHRALAARWLSTLHVAGAQLAAPAVLPDRGCVYYRKLLRLGGEHIVRNLPNPALQETHRVVLQTILSQLDQVARHWDQVESFCAGMPSTLVHGDFVEKNVRLRPGPTGSEMVALDWEEAGWGTPAPDLFDVDLAAYESGTRACWPHLGLNGWRRLAVYGRLFRLLAAVKWAARGLEFPPVDRTINNYMRVYSGWLAETMQAAGWEA